jgi:D-glucosaminate-6-phosphate ammonia-lyase
MTSIANELGLRRLLNCTGGWTAFGAALVHPACLAAAAEISRRPVDMEELQDLASGAIAGATGAEAGVVFNCAAAGLVAAVAGAITGADRARAEQLPDVEGLASRVLLQRCHNVNFSAPLGQMIRMTGARLQEIGWINACEAFHLASALAAPAPGDRPVAAVYVVSYETYAGADIAIERFIEMCRAAEVPVIVDVAGEADPRPYIAMGADLVVISVHKQLGGLTAGIVAGRRDLVAAARIQLGAIARPGKPSKESIASTLAALEILRGPEAGQRPAALARRIDAMVAALARVEGLSPARHAYPVPGEQLNLRVGVDPGRLDIGELIRRLESEDPVIRVRKEGMAAGYFVLNLRNLEERDDGELVELIRRRAAAAGNRR